MGDRLVAVFRAYTDAVRSLLQDRPESPRVKGPLRLVVNKALELTALVENLENTAEFQQLILGTRSSYSGDYHGKSDWAWQGAAKNFFRRSGYYIDIYEGKVPPTDTNTNALNGVTLSLRATKGSVAISQAPLCQYE